MVSRQKSEARPGGGCAAEVWIFGISLGKVGLAGAHDEYTWRLAGSTGTGADRRCEGGERTRGRLLRTAIHYIDPDDVGHYLVVGMGILA